MGISEFFQLPVNRFIFSHLPLRLAFAFGVLVGEAYFFLHRRKRALIVVNIRRALGGRYSEKEMRRLVRATFRGISKHYAEKLFQAFYHPDKVLSFIRKGTEVRGLDSVGEALARGRGALLITGHFGALEFLPTLLGLLGCNPHILVNFKTPELKRNCELLARRIGATVVDINEGNPLFRCLKILEGNKVLITECDEIEAWESRKSDSIRLLGERVGRDRSIDLLQRRSGAAILTAFMLRKAKVGGYELQIQKMDDSGSRGMSPRAQVLKVLEDYILAHPDQWYQWNNWGSLQGAGATSETRSSQDERRSLLEKPRPVSTHSGDRVPEAAA